MPVPTTPTKSDVGTKTNVGVAIMEPPNLGPSPPDPCVVAGYQDCLRETIRFLVQEEQLSSEHPVVAGLSMHLTTTTAQQELEKISNELAKTLNEDLRRKKMMSKSSSQNERQNLVKGDTEDDSGLDNTLSEDEDERIMIPSGVKTYQITLEEDISDDDYDMEVGSDEEFDSDEDMEDEDLVVTAEDILANLTIRRELIRLVFQGCDLVATSNYEHNLTVTDS